MEEGDTKKETGRKTRRRNRMVGRKRGRRLKRARGEGTDAIEEGNKNKRRGVAK